jgi:hypothetical protein
MRRTIRRRVLTALLLLPLATATRAGAVLPGESPADTYGVNGKVRSIVVVGDTVWIGGAFTAVTNGNSTSRIEAADGLVAFSRITGKLATGVAVPRLTGSNIQVWKLATDGLRVWAAGKFSYNGTSKRNLISFNGLTGGNVTTYNGAPLSKSVAVGDKVYVGGTQVAAWPLDGGNKLSGFAPLTLKESIGGHESIAAMRDMLVDGSDVYGACQCSAVIQGGSTTSVNSLIRFSAGDGALDKAFSTRVPGQIGEGSFGLGIAGDDSGVYLAAGGSDYVAKFNFDGTERWHTDTSGSAQTLTLTTDRDQLVVGGHFQWVEVPGVSQCGSNQSPNRNCASRLRLMAVDPGTGVVLGWNPGVCCQYNGLWATTADGSSIHIGGSFTKVHNVAQTFYARLDTA